MRPTHALLLLAVLCCPRSLAAEEPHWFTDFHKARAAAKEEQRPLLIYFTSSGCPWCHEMWAKTFGNPEVAEEISKSFVVVSVKGDEDEALAEKFKVIRYPTVIIVVPDKHILDRLEGFKPPSEFRQRLAELNSNKNLQR